MLDGNRLEGITALVFGLVIGGLLAAAYFTSPSQQDGNVKSEQTATDRYAQRAQERIQVLCSVLDDPVRIFQCEQEIIDAAEEDRAAQQDLQQQTAMAKWAFWMMVFSAFSVCVTAVGILYVRLTLDQTVSANKAAQAAVAVTREVGEAQVRAYLSITNVEVEAITNNLPSLVVRIKNTGGSPALKLNGHGYLILSYQEEGEDPGTILQRTISASLVMGRQRNVSPDMHGDIIMHVPANDTKLNAEEMKTILERQHLLKNPVWSAQLFFNWVDVFGFKFSFLGSVGQPFSDACRSGNLAMSGAILQVPFEIRSQSDNRKQSDS